MKLINSTVTVGLLLTVLQLHGAEAADMIAEVDGMITRLAEAQNNNGITAN